MATVTATAKKKTEKLPNPPGAAKAKKTGKAWIAKRADTLKRVLKAATSLKEKFAPAVAGEVRPEWKEKLVAAGRIVDTIHANAAEALKQLAVLETGNYVPEGSVRGVKLANGAQVWLRGKVWLKKYKGLYQPAELDGLTISNIVGKKAMAKATGGT